MQRKFLINMAMNELDLKHDFKDFKINARLSFDDGELIALFGDSGSGKSTILKLIAGLINKPLLKDIAFLFQDCTLFDNFNVYENLVFTNTKTLLDDLKYILGKKLDKNTSNFYDELLKLANLEEHKTKKISTLSGGQKQRLALICALSKNAKCILLDEPLSALDDSNKIALIKLIKKINQDYKRTIIFVSHSCFEINALADKIYFVKNGSFEKCLNKEEFFIEKIQNNEFLCKN